MSDPRNFNMLGNPGRATTRIDRFQNRVSDRIQPAGDTVRVPSAVPRCVQCGTQCQRVSNAWLCARRPHCSGSASLDSS